MIVYITLFKYIFSFSLALNFLSKKLAMSAIAEDVPFLLCKGESSYKYIDLDINDEELYSNRIGDRIRIQKIDAIDLLTEKIDFNKLGLCANFNLHYCDKPFIVKLDHFPGFIMEGICQKKDQLLIVP